MQKLILISERQDDLEFASAASAETGWQLIPTATPKDAVVLLSFHPSSVVFADISSYNQFESFHSEFKSIVGEGEGMISSNRVHFLSTEPIDRFQEFLRDNLFGHFIVRKNTKPSDAGRHYGQVMRTLYPDGGALPVIETFTLSRLDEKELVISAIRDYFLRLNFSDRICNSIATATDELLLNAIYDAADIANDRMSEDSRWVAPDELKGRREVEVRVGYDQEHASITVIDHYGSLSKEAVLKHVFKSFAGQYNVDGHAASAGIGLANTFRTGGSFVFHSKPGSWTEVTVLFRRSASYREFRNQTRFVSVCLSDSTDVDQDPLSASALHLSSRSHKS